MLLNDTDIMQFHYCSAPQLGVISLRVSVYTASGKFTTGLKFLLRYSVHTQPRKPYKNLLDA